MKKLTAISILLVLLSTAAFAQLKVGFTSNIWTDAVFFEKATGDMADADQVKGAFNIFASNRLNGNELRLKLTYAKAFDQGSLEAMLELKGDSVIRRSANGFGGNAYWVDLNGNGAVDAGEIFVDNLHQQGVANGGISLQSFLEQGFGDFHVKGTAWVFEGFIGNTDQRGALSDYRFADFGDFVGGKLENYGVVKFPQLNIEKFNLKQDATGVLITSGNQFVWMAGIGTTDTDNLKWGTSYTSLGLNLNAISVPLKIEVGSNAAFNGFGDVIDLNTTIQDGSNPSTSADAIYGTFRISGTKIADFISFDAVYRVNGEDPSTRLTYNNYVDDPLDTNQTNTTAGGQWQHEIGAYVGLDLFKGFALGVGYTAAFQYDEQTRVDNTDPDSATVEFINPVFNGIDLRLKFTGIDGLGISLNNNVSFAWQRGEAPIDSAAIANNSGGRIIQPMGYWIPGWGATTDAGNPGARNGATTPGMDAFATTYGGGDGDGTNVASRGLTQDVGAILGTGNAANMWNTDMKDSWFALHNSLGVSYAITPRATVQFAITNRLGIYEFVAEPDRNFASWTTDNFQAGLAGIYAFNSNIQFAAGLNLSIWGMEAKVTTTYADPDPLRSPEEVTGKIGEVRLAIPIQFKVSF